MRLWDALWKGDMSRGGAAPSGDFTKGAGKDYSKCRVSDNAHPCAVSLKTAIRGRFTLEVGLLPK
ncbi:MAG: hypothetical protein K2I21_16175 [Acetatifactor sp.]|nr:hypothetical protein [Acetatifactor sp.]